ncbi:MAG TPA: hypothetical protein VJV05_18115 [Pyrinomonadaceae bacterium]|nr:hypothetical protein [Pyrinomonadaceae bacterium]
MSKFFKPQIAVLYLLLLCLLSTGAEAQKKKGKATKPAPQGEAVMWEPVSTKELDLYAGPGGDEMRPDISRVTFIKEEKKGANKKYRIKDANGRVWVAKLGREARPETAAVRLLYGLGYKTEVNYLVPTITIPGKGTFRNVRLEARPDDVERIGEWKWKSNPFVGTREYQGLKMMMVFMSNWDVVDVQTEILQVGPKEHQYIVSDLGATFGKLGNNNLPIIYRLGRKTGSPKHYARTGFVRDVSKGELRLAYKGKNRKLFKGFTVEEGRWLSNQLNRLSDTQIGDAFRAANYSPSEIDSYTRTVRRKIAELDRAVNDSRLADIR